MKGHLETNTSSCKQFIHEHAHVFTMYSKLANPAWSSLWLWRSWNYYLLNYDKTDLPASRLKYLINSKFFCEHLYWNQLWVCQHANSTICLSWIWITVICSFALPTIQPWPTDNTFIAHLDLGLTKQCSWLTLTLTSVGHIHDLSNAGHYNQPWNIHHKATFIANLDLCHQAAFKANLKLCLWAVFSANVDHQITIYFGLNTDHLWL